MAITMNYEHVNDTENKIGNLAKVVFDGVTYYLNDADLRAIVAAFGTATGSDVETADKLAAGTTSAKLPTSAQVVDYVDDAVAGLSGAMHFVGISTTDPTTAVTIEDKASYTPEAGDVVLFGTGKEFVYTGSAWREFGDESIYALKATTFAGLDLSRDRSVADVQTALKLASFAYVDQGTASYTPAGTISVELKDASQDTEATIEEYADYTPAGSIDIAGTTSAGATSYTPDGQIGQTITKKAFHAGSVTTVKSGDDAPSTTFATSGITVSIDNDTLTFGDASTAVALVANDIATGTAPSIDDSSDDNSVEIVTDASTPSWRGTAQYFSFSGTAVNDKIPSKITYTKQEVDTDATKTKFVGTPDTITVTPKVASGD